MNQIKDNIMSKVTFRITENRHNISKATLINSSTLD